MVHVKPRELLEYPNGKAEGNQQPSRETGRFNDYPKGVGDKSSRSAGLFLNEGVDDIVWPYGKP